SSRRRHTRWPRDWSSDVCSSDLVDIRPSRNLDKFIGTTDRFAVVKYNRARGNVVVSRRALLEKERDSLKHEILKILEEGVILERSEERRVGKECRSG